MSPTIEELLPLSQTLNAESNDLNKTIATISDKLAALNLGIEVWIDVQVYTGFEDSQVGFGKVGESWQLAYRPYDTADLEPLLRASRDVRIEGLRLVPQIVTGLKSAAEDRIRVMQEAKQFATEL
jgi:hypothetical protein